MKLLEYQAKEQFVAAGIPVKDGRVARTVEQVVDAATLLGPIAVKAQVPIGGRGKAGGIKLAKTPEEAREAAQAILGMDGTFTVRPEKIRIAAPDDDDLDEA